MPLPAGSLELTEIREWRDGRYSRDSDSLATEEPLEIRVGSVPLVVTMRTPGHDRELAAGYLWTEGVIDSPDQIDEFRQLSKHTGAPENVIEVHGAASLEPREAMRGNLLATSSCGVCGKAYIEAIRSRDIAPLTDGFKIDPELLCQLPERARAEQEVFGRTGGLHAAALFSEKGELLVLREDIGRHNAVDKIVGWALLNRLLPLSRCILLASGRGGFEIVQKALTAGIPVLACVSAPSSLAVKLAREFNLALIGFLRERRFVVYSGGDRLSGDSVSAAS
ncbi:MAG TPA: formate dehydrogenase accessory sulfurtransferase FdhD [Terracidiphilus sp.]|nr:formate dehydrogenase accessory sulfurtransferase FdhD [Terracidiphilus sp.]